jgi:RNA polymerase sigma factor (TIGR02999 family)
VGELKEEARNTRNGEPNPEELLEVLYGELRGLAARQLAGELPGQTLQPTALVHEAWLRLGADDQPRWKNRAHFLGAAAEAMRRILVDRARRKLRVKHGGHFEHVESDDRWLQAPAEDEKVLEVHEALEKLAAEDREKAEIVKLRFFVGLRNGEIAALLGVSEKTVQRHWELAKVRLFKSIQLSG